MNRILLSISFTFIFVIFTKGEPLSFDIGPLKAADIIEYRWSDHTFKLRDEAVAKLPKMPFSLSGVSFDVVVNGETIYSGLFVPSISSMTYKKPTIVIGNQEGPTNVFVIRRPFYPEGMAVDPRFNDRLKNALRANGKLKEEDNAKPEVDRELTEKFQSF